jgi:hypothetical protein
VIPSRWIGKNTTDCDDLIEVVWIISNDETLIERFDKFLASIRPESGWREETGFNPDKPTTRNRPYGDDYYG